MSSLFKFVITAVLLAHFLKSISNLIHKAHLPLVSNPVSWDLVCYSNMEILPPCGKMFFATIISTVG